MISCGCTTYLGAHQSTQAPAQQPSASNVSRLSCWFNNAKKSAKSLFTLWPRLSPHLLPDLETLAAAEREPVVEIDLLGDLEVLGDSHLALHGRIVLRPTNGNAQESNAFRFVGRFDVGCSREPDIDAVAAAWRQHFGAVSGPSQRSMVILAGNRGGTRRVVASEAGHRAGPRFLLGSGRSRGPRYDPRVPESRAAKPRPPSNDAERERLIAAIEEGLADLDAGRSYSHAEVLAELRERFPPSPK